jgi:putative transposase
MHRPLPDGANVRRVVIKREANGHWYALVGWDVELPQTAAEDGRPAVGLDFGLSALITTSDGDKVAPPRNYKRLQRKLRRKQRRLSRAKKGSNRRKKARRDVAVVHAKIRNRRRDFLHNVSRKVVDDYGLIAVEDLSINNMVKNKHLSGSILDSGWGELAAMLTYKAESAGTAVAFVDPRNTSQICSGCGQVVKKDLSVRIHSCDCGLIMDRDQNAAINILYRAVQAQRQVT